MKDYWLLAADFWLSLSLNYFGFAIWGVVKITIHNYGNGP